MRAMSLQVRAVHHVGRPFAPRRHLPPVERAARRAAPLRALRHPHNLTCITPLPPPPPGAAPLRALRRLQRHRPGVDGLPLRRGVAPPGLPARHGRRGRRGADGHLDRRRGAVRPRPQVAVGQRHVAVGDGRAGRGQLRRLEIWPVARADTAAVGIRRFDRRGGDVRGGDPRRAHPAAPPAGDAAPAVHLRGRLTPRTARAARPAAAVRPARVRAWLAAALAAAGLAQAARPRPDHGRRRERAAAAALVPAAALPDGGTNAAAAGERRQLAVPRWREPAERERRRRAQRDARHQLRAEHAVGLPGGAGQHPVQHQRLHARLEPAVRLEALGRDRHARPRQRQPDLRLRVLLHDRTSPAALRRISSCWAHVVAGTISRATTTATRRWARKATMPTATSRSPMAATCAMARPRGRSSTSRARPSTARGASRPTAWSGRL